MKFPKDFIFGAATAAYQAEGAVDIDGRGKCYWDEFYHQPDSRFNADVASDFYHKYPEDLKLAHEFGINGIRISISWARIFPEGTGKVNQKGIDFYHQLIDECLKNGVEPFVTLHHFDTPLPLFKEGDWLNRKTVTAFLEYAKVCFDAYGDKVKYWITINEPWSVVAGQYIIGHFPPNIRYDVPKAVDAMHNMMLAHAEVAAEYKRRKLDGKIGVVQILERKYPLEDTDGSREAALKEDVLANRFMLDACFKGAYTTETLGVINQILSHYDTSFTCLEDDQKILKTINENTDFLGINYYASHFLIEPEEESNIYHNGTGEKGTSKFTLKGIGTRITPTHLPTTSWDWIIHPEGLYDMIKMIDTEYRPGLEIFVTENGFGAIEEQDGEMIIQDDERISYIKKHLEVVHRLIEEGQNVKGYFLWSMMDMFSWTNGYNKRYGLFYVDFETQKRTPKKSATWWKKISEEKGW